MGSVMPVRAARAEQHAPGEAVAHGDAAAFDDAFACRLGELAAMNDCEPVADAPGLVDGEIVVARPDDEARTSGRDLADAGGSDGFAAGLGSREELLLVDARRELDVEEPPPKMLEPRPEVTEERPQPPATRASAAQADAAPARAANFADCTVAPQSSRSTASYVSARPNPQAAGGDFLY